MTKPKWIWETDPFGNQYKHYVGNRYFIHKPAGFAFFYVYNILYKAVYISYGKGYDKKMTEWSLSDMLNPAFEFQETDAETIKQKFPRGVL